MTQRFPIIINGNFITSNSDNNYLVIPLILSYLTRSFIGNFSNLRIPQLKYISDHSEDNENYNNKKHDFGRLVIACGALVGASVTAIPRLRIFDRSFDSFNNVNNNSGSSQNNREFVVEWAMVFGSTLLGSLLYDASCSIINIIKEKIKKGE